MEFHQLSGKSTALVMWGTDDKGNDDVAVFAGTIVVKEGELFFHRDNEEVHFEMPFDDLERIKPVPANLKDTLLDCDYYVNLIITPYPEDDNPDDYTSTGLKWPEQEEPLDYEQFSS